MGSLKTHAIVLRHVAYKDSDRMLTLFSPTLGRVEAVARGCLKQKSGLCAASEVFACGEFQLFAKGERHTVTGYAPQDSFYPLREDYDRLKHGAYLLSLIEAAVQPGDGQQGLYVLLLEALSYLTYSPKLSPQAVTALFLMAFAHELGYRPELDRCARCGRVVAEGTWGLDALAGGVVCPACGAGGETVAPQTLAFLRVAQGQGIDMLKAGEPQGASQALPWLRRVVEGRMEKRIKAARLL